MTLDIDYVGQSKFGGKAVGNTSGRDYDKSGGHTAEPLNLNDHYY